MRKIIIAIALIALISAKMAEGLLNIATTKEDALINNKYISFIVVDDETNYVLSKNPVKYDAALEMPLHFFTVENAAMLTQSERQFVIHNLLDDEYDWVLEDNPEEGEIFYSRSKFVMNGKTMSWKFIVRGERILMKNVASGNFLKITEDGKFQRVSDESQASKWKLIHVY